MSSTFTTHLNFGGGKRLPTILQTEASECGLACLAMVASYYGRKTDLVTLRREHAVSLKGSTFKTVMDIAHRLGLASRAIRLDLDELHQLRTPAILHWNLDHFVVLRRVSRGHVLIHDPAHGPRRLPLQAISDQFTGAALELIPAAGFVVKDERESLCVRQLFKEAIGLRSFMGRLLLLSLLLQAIALLTPFYVQLAIDEAVLRVDRSFLLLLAAGFLVIAVFQTSLGWIRSWSVMYLGTQLGPQIQTNLLRHLLRLPLDFFQKRHIGDIVSRFGSVSAIQGLVTTGLIEAIVDGFLLTFTFAVMCLYETGLTALVAFVLLAYAGLRLARYQTLRDLSLENVIAAAENSSHFMETIRGVATIKLFGLEMERMSQWQNRVVGLTNTSILISKLSLAFGVVSKLLFGFANIAIVYFGAIMVMEQSLTIGMLMAFLSYQGQFLGAGANLIDQWISFKLLDVHLERVRDIAHSAPEEDPILAESPITNVPARLNLRGVSFRYSPTEPLLFENVTLSVEPGECVAIIGPSGVGKSSLLRLVLGLSCPERGTVCFGGIDISRLGLSNYRRLIAAVTQEDRLLSGSIAANITLFDPKPEFPWMVECARLCGIHDAVMSLPMNYHSLVGDMGDILSAGERQRLMLARALYRKPKMLVLDEATCHLDGELDRQINGMLASLDVTRLIVTHRQTPLIYADRVFRLDRRTLEPVADAAFRMAS
jgi:ATP-binding cassette, subfamily B, bacterial CvaB/MchF/RaxB